MEDYLSEDDQWEALKRWLKENGAWIIGGVVLGAALLFGSRWWDDHTTKKSEAAATVFDEVQAAIAANDPAKAAERADKLQQDYAGTPYPDHAQLALAGAEVGRGELDKAAQRLSAVADKAEDEYLRQVARLRLARVQLAQNKADDAIASLDKLKAGSFSGLASEVRGDALLAKGDRKGALDAYRAASLEAGPGSAVDGEALQLKINDLASPTPPPAPAAAAKSPEGAAPDTASKDAATKDAASKNDAAKTAPKDAAK